MSKPVSPVAIGSFLLGGLGLLIAALLIFGGGEIFRPKLQCVVFFDSSLNGLNRGAPVKVQGVQVGTVKEIVLELDLDDHRLMKPVVLEIDPATLTDPSGHPLQSTGDRTEQAENIRRLVETGLRARLEMQSILTGLLYVELNFYRDIPEFRGGISYRGLPEIPSVPTTVDEVKASLEEVVRKIRNMPLDTIVNDISATVADIRAIIASEETGATRAGLATSMTETAKLIGDLNRQLPPLLNQMSRTVDNANRTLRGADESLRAAAQTAADASETAREATTLIRSVRSESQPVLAAARESLVKAGVMLERAQVAVDNIADTTAPDSALQQTLTELQNAARAIRILGDYLERHPDALIFGKSRD